jgi:hypothetical protein
MGMYDDIVCKYPLPLPEDTKGFHPCGFQTKDLENALDCYEIREDGTLWLRECEREYIDGDPKGKTWSDKIGLVKETKVWWTPVKITKSINMYTYQQGEGQYDYWVDFAIVFIDGVLQKIELKKFDVTNNTERKENFRLHIEELKRRKEFESTLFYKLFGKPFNKTIWFSTRTLNTIGSFLIDISYKLYRNIKI